VIAKKEVIHKQVLERKDEETETAIKAKQIEINVLIERLKSRDEEIEHLNVALLKFADHQSLIDEISKLK